MYGRRSLVRLTYTYVRIAWTIGILFVFVSACVRTYTYVWIFMRETGEDERAEVSIIACVLLP